jgi:hypothetical protein
MIFVVERHLRNPSPSADSAPRDEVCRICSLQLFEDNLATIEVNSRGGDQTHCIDGT